MNPGRLGITLQVLVLASACGRGDGGDNKRKRAAAAVFDAARVELEPTSDARPASPIPDHTRQLIVGITASWESPNIELRRFARSNAAEPWQLLGDPWKGTVGKSGLAWGVGLHGTGRPDVGAGAGPVKREGDGRASAGVFRIGSAYGYSKNPPGGTGITYQQATSNWRCVDDVRSSRYNTIFDSKGITRDWKSAELMRRADPLYEWVIDIEHNFPRPTAHAGSCIFFHVWRGPGRPTVGCTAMPKPAIEDLLFWLDPAGKPIYVALPRDRYRSLRPRWSLPAL